MVLDTGGKIIVSLSGLASALGGSSVLLTFALFKEIRIVNFGYLVFMTISDTLFGLLYFLYSIHLPEDDSWQCALGGKILK